MEEQEECCGNGCNTCVLDKKKVPKDVNLMDNVIDNRYQWFKVSDIRQETPTVFSLEFQYESSDHEKCLVIPPGAHLMMRIPVEHISKDASKVFTSTQLQSPCRERRKLELKRSTNDPEMIQSYVSRPYSPYSFDPERHIFRILFRYEGGDMSQRIIRLNIGDQVEWKGFYYSLGEFNYKRNMFRNLVCICQGVAVAPMVNIIRHILSDEDDETILHLYVCFKDFPDILLKESLRDFMNYWNFKLSLFLPHHNEFCKTIKASSSCNCQEKNKLFTETIYFHRITIESIIKPHPDTLYILSGSEEFLSNISNSLMCTEIPSRNIIKL